MKPRQFAIEVTRKLQDAGYVALWAGGCVRDQLLGLTPKDYDVATSAEPTQVRELFGHRRTLPIGAAFGVITVLGPRSAGSIEVATFRRDESYSDGRRPDAVTYSSPEQDASRRDFTINGLFFDPIRDEVIDYVNGQADLKAKIVRAIGDASERIAEDKLRMLRAIRFAAKFDFELEAQTAATIARHAHEINVVSNERIAGEMERMLVHHSRARALKLLLEKKLLTPIFPLTERFLQQPECFETLGEVLNQLSQPTFSAVLALLVHWASENNEQTLSALNDLQTRWRLSNQAVGDARWLTSSLPLIERAEELPFSRLQPLLIDSRIEQALQLVAPILKVAGREAVAIEHCQSYLAWERKRLDPAPLVKGSDLKANGYSPSPGFAVALQAVRNAQLDGEISSEEEGLAMAIQILKEWQAEHS